jgi:hypothetical protein
MPSSQQNRGDIAASPRAGSLWAITSYFNPMRYQSKRANYRVFREHLNVPLVAVELAYSPDFELDEGDADILVQLRGRDVMWQKERLLNVALQALPRTCNKVIWVDGDIVFEAKDWPERVSRHLDRFIIMQTFSNAYLTPQNWIPGDFRPSVKELMLTRRSVVSAISSGQPAQACLFQPDVEPRVARYAKGLGWAARRELLDRHGFYDAGIIGAGDLAMAGACYGCFEAVMRRTCMNDRQKERYLAWAEPVYEAVRGAVDFMEGDLFHLWHGDENNRRMRERHEELQRFQFDPFEDVAIDENGSWRWNTNKPEMHEYLRNYFASRKEDG